MQRKENPRLLMQQQKINVQSEVLEFAETSSTSAEGLATSVSDTEPRFSFFRYTHDLEGSRQSSLIFIYTCPPGSKIRERMLYASSKLGVIRAAEEDLGLEFAKKVPPPRPFPHCLSTISFEKEEAALYRHLLMSENTQFEASSPSEITASMIEEEFRPKQEQKQGFSRPKRPGKR